MVRCLSAAFVAFSSVLVFCTSPQVPLRAGGAAAVPQGVAVGDATVAPGSRDHLAAHLLQVPLHFTRNDQVTDADVEFFARGRGYAVGLKGTRATIRLAEGPSATTARAEIDVSLVGASSTAAVGEGRLPGVLNVYRGNNRSTWREGLPTFARVRYAAVYPGIDLVYYGNQTRLQYDFIVEPGGDPRRIAWRVDGADALEVDDAGHLQIRVGGRAIEQERPFTYQVVDGERREVPSRFVVEAAIVRFDVGAYDRSRPLVIDPVLTYSSWFGGRSQESISDIAVDSSGNILVTGASEDRDGYPTTAAALRSSRGADLAPADAFVAKFSPSGATLLFSTLLGGSDDDNLVAAGAVGGVAALPDGSIVVVGATKSPDFPVLSADDATFNETTAIVDPDAYLTILSPTGALVSSTFLGGADTDFATNVDVDAAGRIYVTGITRSDNVTEGFPITASTYDGTIGGTNDVFLVRYSTSGVRQYATYIGGSGGE